MNRILSKTGFTLIELIVSSLLVTIVVFGIITINTVLTNNNQDYGQRYLVKSETQTTLNHILNNAALAVGTANANDEAVLYSGNYAGFDRSTFCIHQPGGAGNNLINFASDIWLCYSWTNDYQIKWCAETYTGPGADPRGAASCSTAATLPGGRPTFLGTAFSSPSATFTNSGGQSQFSITIKNCLNNSASTCDTGAPSGTGISADPANNPEVKLSGSVIPLQASSSP